MKVLIVGANSFLATSLADALHALGHTIVGLYHHSQDRMDVAKFKSLYNDQQELMEHESQFDVVYIVGAYIPYGNFGKADSRYVDTNITLVATLSQRYTSARLVFCSSVSVYGNPLDNMPLNERSVFNNPSLYGYSKLAGEAVVLNHPSFAVLRFSSIWGNGMTESTYLPRVVKQAKDGEIVLWGTGARQQNYIHVADAAQMCVSAAQLNENWTLLGVYPKSYSNLEIASIVAHRIGAKIRHENEDLSPSFLFDARFTYEKIKFTPSIAIEDQIDQLL